MYIVISSDSRIPLDLQTGFQVEKWTPQEFFEKASSDDGLELDEGIWYDVSDLPEDIYEALSAYAEANVSITYYHFSDRSLPDFNITDNIVQYKVPEENNVTVPEEVPNEATPMTTLGNQAEAVNPVYTEPAVTPVAPVIQAPIQPQPAQVPPVTPVTPVQPAQQQMMQAPPVYTEQPIYTSANPVSNIELSQQQLEANLGNLLQYDDYDSNKPRRKAKPAKVVLFGSSKGGSGKTFTCIMSAYWYAKKHPTEKVALADFDIIDGQVGITINKLTPTMQEYYKLYMGGKKDFNYLENNKVKSDKFSPNIDFYLAPSQDIPQITNDNDFWTNVFENLISNYDVVFFDSGIDYIGKLPISKLYKIADHIFITCNPSLNSVKSVIKQLKTLAGIRQNNTFRQSEGILSKIKVIMTRVDPRDTSINKMVNENITKFAPIVATFGQIDSTIKEVQWYQLWLNIDADSTITEQLDKIIDF